MEMERPLALVVILGLRRRIILNHRFVPQASIVSHQGQVKIFGRKSRDFKLEKNVCPRLTDHNPNSSAPKDVVASSDDVDIFTSVLDTEPVVDIPFFKFKFELL